MGYFASVLSDARRAMGTSAPMSPARTTPGKGAEPAGTDSSEDIPQHRAIPNETHDSQFWKARGPNHSGNNDEFKPVKSRERKDVRAGNARPGPDAGKSSSPSTPATKGAAPAPAPQPAVRRIPSNSADPMAPSAHTWQLPRAADFRASVAKGQKDAADTPPSSASVFALADERDTRGVSPPLSTTQASHPWAEGGLRVEQPTIDMRLPPETAGASVSPVDAAARAGSSAAFGEGLTESGSIGDMRLPQQATEALPASGRSATRTDDPATVVDRPIRSDPSEDGGTGDPTPRGRLVTWPQPESEHARPKEGLREVPQVAETPRLVIGHIEVIVESVPQPQRPTAQTSSFGDLSSRYYLRGL